MSQREAIERERQRAAELRTTARQRRLRWWLRYGVLVLGALALVITGIWWFSASASAGVDDGLRESVAAEQDRAAQADGQVTERWRQVMAELADRDAGQLAGHERRLRQSVTDFVAGDTRDFDSEFAASRQNRLGSMYGPTAQDVDVLLVRTDKDGEHYLISWRMAPSGAEQDMARGAWAFARAQFDPEGNLKPIMGRWVQGVPVGR